MIDYVKLLLLAVAVAWCADHASRKRTNAGQRRRLIICTLVLLVLLAGFAGLRTRCNDTGAYRHSYEMLTEGSWAASDKQLGSNPLFNWVNYRLKLAGVSTQNFLMFWAFLTVGCYLLFLHRYSADYPLTVFLLFTTGCYPFVFAGIKQAAAIGFAVLAVMFWLRKKRILYLLCVIIATLLHPYSLLYLLVPVMQFRPWTRKTYVLLLLAVGCGFLLEPLLGTIVSITAMLGEGYSVASFSEAGVNIFRVLVCNVPTFLSFVYRKRLFADSSPAENLFVNLTMLNGAIMFVGLFGTANYFARLANYFLIFQSLSLPWMLKKLGGKPRRNLTLLMLLGYSGYFAYANLIAIPFDSDFHRLTVSEYFALLKGR